MVDLLNDLDPGRRGDRVASKLPSLVIVISAIKLVGAICRVVTFWNLDSGNLEVVLGLTGGVRTEEKSVGRVGFVGGSGNLDGLGCIGIRIDVRTTPYRGTTGMSDSASREHV